MILSGSDTLEVAVEKLAGSHTGATGVLADVVLRCRDINPNLEHPAQVLIQLDRYKIHGPYIYGLFEACGSDLVKFLAVLQWAQMGRLRPTDVRAAVTVKYGHTPPPWYRPIDAAHILSMVRAQFPEFGAPPA